MDLIEHFKSQFFSPRKFLHLNNAGNAPLSTPAYERILHWTNRFYTEGVHAIPEAYAQVDIARGKLARFLGAEPEEVAFFQSTAAALSQVALGISLKPGDEILLWDQEYPSNHYPWRVAAEKSGAKLVIAESGPHLETSVDQLLSYVTPNTKVIAVSWVQYRTGAITDLQKLTEHAQKAGIFTCADIIQGAGVLPFDFQRSGLDAACGGSHKWLLSGPSVGYLCLRKKHLADFSPIHYGAMTFGSSDDLSGIHAHTKSDSHKFEPGSLPLLNISALAASIDLLVQVGVDRIAQEAEWLTKKLSHGLLERGYQVNSPHGTKFRGTIINFSSGSNSALRSLEKIEEALSRSGVCFAKRPGKNSPGVRLSPHAFNTNEEIEAVLSALE